MSSPRCSIYARARQASCDVVPMRTRRRSWDVHLGCNTLACARRAGRASNPVTDGKDTPLRKLPLALIALVAVAVVAVAVTPGAFAKNGATLSVVHLTAVKSGLAYNTKKLTAKAGRIKLVFTNLSPLKHNVKLEQGEKEFGGTKTISTGATSVIVTLKKGVYHFYCSVPGHEGAGMSGYLTVS